MKEAGRFSGTESALLPHDEYKESNEFVANYELGSVVAETGAPAVHWRCVNIRRWGMLAVTLAVVLGMFCIARPGKGVHHTSSSAFIGRAQISQSLTGVSCRSGSWLLGMFHTQQECAEAVRANGGKNFEYGSSEFGGMFNVKQTAKPCIMKFTAADAENSCPQGLVPAEGTQYSKVKGVPDEALVSCRADLIKLGFYQRGGGDLVKQETFVPNATGFVEKSAFASLGKPMPLLSGTNKAPVLTSLGAKRAVCKVEYSLECPTRHGKIKVRQSCCESWSWNPDCVPLDLSPATEKIMWLDPLVQRGDYSEICPSESEVINAGLGQAIQRTIPLHACATAQLVQRTVTLGEQMESCPTLAPVIAKAFEGGDRLNRLWTIFFPDAASSISVKPRASDLNPFVFDVYTMSMDAVSTFMASMLKKTPVPIPQAQGFSDRSVVFTTKGNPRYDIDQDEAFLWPVPQFTLYCAVEAFRMFVIVDSLNTGVENQWAPLLVGNAHPNGTTLTSLKVGCPDMLNTCTMKQFVVGAFNGYKTGNGDPVWPKQVIDFDQFRLPTGAFVDDAEKFLAFEHIGSHRLQAEADGGWSLDSLALKDLAVRPGFAKLGAKMWFDSTMEPVKIETPTGQFISKGETDQDTWNYWKFCWRSSMVLYITLVDHFWLIHFTFANALSAASREALPSGHPLRRLISPFTYDSIKVTDMLTHLALGPNHLLHRATGVADYYEVQRLALRELPAASDIFANFYDAQKLASLEATIKNTPFFQDGSWLFDALAKFVDAYVDIYKDQWCDVQGFIKDKHILWFLERSNSWSLIAEHEQQQHLTIGLLLSENGTPHCDGLKKYLAMRLFAVSGFHNHVSQVYDMLSTPDFVSFGWKEGEHAGRPMQHMDAVLMFANTAGFNSPNKLVSDFSYIIQGMERAVDGVHVAKATEAFQSLKSSMDAVAQRIDTRNNGRKNPYLQMNPRYVDSSADM